VYEYLLQFTDDAYVKETLQYLMTREIAHMQMFEAALSTIKVNFPPGVLQADPRLSNSYFNMSNGTDAKGPWNEGKSPAMGETWEYIEDPLQFVIETNGLVNKKPIGTSRTIESTEEKNKEMKKMRSMEVSKSVPMGGNQWSSYPQKNLKSLKAKL